MLLVCGQVCLSTTRPARAVARDDAALIEREILVAVAGLDVDDVVVEARHLGHFSNPVRPSQSATAA